MTAMTSRITETHRVAHVAEHEYLQIDAVPRTCVALAGPPPVVT
jgi:hypothetical protein